LKGIYTAENELPEKPFCFSKRFVLKRRSQENTEQVSAEQSSDARVTALKRIKPPSDWFAKFATSMLGLIVAFGAFEIGFRLYTRYTPVREIKKDRPTVYYAPSDSTSPSDFRYAREKAPDTFRVAALGDSFTFPTHMQFDDAFPKRLERMLRLASGMKAEVINFGQMGASAKSEIVMLERAVTYHPDVIILEITLNDPEPKNLHKERKKNPLKYNFGKLVITEEDHPLLFRWKSLSYLLERVHNNGTLDAVINYYRDMWKPEGRWETFTKSYLEMKRIADQNQIPLVTMTFPLFYTPIDARYPFRDVHEQISKFMKSIDVPNLDLLPYFEGMNPERLVVLPGEDSHPNEIAHRVATDALYQWLESTHLIPEKYLIRKRYYRRGLHPERTPANSDYPLQSPEWDSANDNGPGDE